VSFITFIGYPDHHVWLSAPVQELLAALEDDRDAGFVSGVRRLDTAMRDICSRLGVTDTVTPHDLRRTFATRAAEIEIGEDAIDRVLNHKKHGVTKIYIRHLYRNEDKRTMESVAAHLLWLAKGARADKVVPFTRGNAAVR